MKNVQTNSPKIFSSLNTWLKSQQRQKSTLEHNKFTSTINWLSELLVSRFLWINWWLHHLLNWWRDSENESCRSTESRCFVLYWCFYYSAPPPVCVLDLSCKGAWPLTSWLLARRHVVGLDLCFLRVQTGSGGLEQDDPELQHCWVETILQRRDKRARQVTTEGTSDKTKTTNCRSLLEMLNVTFSHWLHTWSCPHYPDSGGTLNPPASQRHVVTTYFLLSSWVHTHIAAVQ